MQYRRFGRTNWLVSEMGYGMWGMGGWTGSDDEESMQGLHRAVQLGCNFFDTALAYGEGHSERLLGNLVRAHPDKTLYTATKIPPKNRMWPGRPSFDVTDVFPYDYIVESTERSLSEPRPRSRRSACSFTSGTTRGPRTTAGSAPSTDLKRAGQGPRLRHQRQPLAARERHPGDPDRARRRRAGGLQHFRPESRRRAVPGLPGA